METRMDKNGAKIDVGVVGIGMLVGMRLPASLLSLLGIMDYI